MFNQYKKNYGHEDQWIENNELIEEQRTSRPVAARTSLGRVTTQMDDMYIDENSFGIA